MIISEVDERTSSWEDHHPTFRVYLHRGFDDRGLASWTATYDVVDADVLQVVDWAQRQATDQMLYAVALLGPSDVDARGADDRGADDREGTRQGLTWLVGMDGTDDPIDTAGRDTKARMLERLRDPVIVPRADRILLDATHPDLEVDT